MGFKMSNFAPRQQVYFRIVVEDTGYLFLEGGLSLKADEKYQTDPSLIGMSLSDSRINWT
uniref:Uncharacterized protein n=1 Tax=Lepeophtheirus salmonis TaxID=72036 RepID=A0A0K2U3V1_LEPSM